MNNTLMSRANAVGDALLTVRASLEVICPESVGCAFPFCMHLKPHAPVDFKDGNCSTAPTMCLNHTLMCVKDNTIVPTCRKRFEDE
jgi:hypothetical protein